MSKSEVMLYALMLEVAVRSWMLGALLRHRVLPRGVNHGLYSPNTANVYNVVVVVRGAENLQDAFGLPNCSAVVLTSA